MKRLLLLVIAAISCTPTSGQASAADAGSRQKTLVAFRQACIAGELKLTREQGSVVQTLEVPNRIRNPFRWNPTPTNRINVRLIDPKNSYLLIADYDGQTKFEYSKHCIVLSKNLEFGDGYAELERDNPGTKIIQTYKPDFYFNEWTAEPKGGGYVMRMRTLDDGWVALEVLIPSVKK